VTRIIEDSVARQRAEGVEIRAVTPGPKCAQITDAAGKQRLDEEDGLQAVRVEDIQLIGEAELAIGRVPIDLALDVASVGGLATFAGARPELGVDCYK
jgi:hypothetical protein